MYNTLGLPKGRQLGFDEMWALLEPAGVFAYPKSWTCLLWMASVMKEVETSSFKMFVFCNCVISLSETCISSSLPWSCQLLCLKTDLLQKWIQDVLNVRTFFHCAYTVTILLCFGLIFQVNLTIFHICSSWFSLRGIFLNAEVSCWHLNMKMVWGPFLGKQCMCSSLCKNAKEV